MSLLVGLASTDARMLIVQRDPGKNPSKFRRKNAKFDEEIEKKSEIQLFNREKFLAIFDEKIEWSAEVDNVLSH